MNTVLLSAVLPKGSRAVHTRAIDGNSQANIVSCLNNNFGNNEKVSASFYENGLLIAAKLYKRQAGQTWQSAVFERDKRP